MLSLNIDININSHTQTINLRDMMNMPNNLDNLRQHHNLFYHSLDKFLLNLHNPTAIINLLNYCLSLHFNLLILNWRSHLHFGEDIPHHFGSYKLFNLVCYLFYFLSADLYFDRHLLRNLNSFYLLNYISLHPLLSHRYFHWNLLVMNQIY